MFVVAMTALMGFVAVLSSLQYTSAAPQKNTMFVQVTVQNMLLYKQAAISYRIANPTATGVIADAALTSYLPSGYQKTANWVANISGAYTYTYTSDVTVTQASGIGSALAKETDNSFFAGSNVAGVLYSSARGNTGIALPIFIPTGSIVIMGN